MFLLYYFGIFFSEKKPFLRIFDDLNIPYSPDSPSHLPAEALVPLSKVLKLGALQEVKTPKQTIGLLKKRASKNVRQ